MTAVTVVFSECASGSVQWTDQACSVEVSGGEVVVTSSVRRSAPRTQTSDCNWVTWDCGTVELGGGDHTLVYGTGEESFTVPHDGPPVCARNTNG